MGFGLLFIGYLFAFGFTAGTNYILSLFGVVGAVFLYLASKKLSLYSGNFGYAKYSSAVLGAAFFVNAALNICKTYFAPNINATLLNVSAGIVVAVTFLYNFFMYNGIIDISKTANNTKITASSLYNMILMVAYYIAVILARFLFPYFKKVSAVFSFTGVILGYVWLIASVALVFKCYMRICLEGDDNTSDLKNGK